MAEKASKQPEVLPGVDPEQDCERPEGTPDSASATSANSVVVASDIASAGQLEHDDEDDHEHDVTWSTVGFEDGAAVSEAIDAWQPDRSRWAVWLERMALAIEQPVNRVTALQLNPLYHTGTIAVLLLAIVGVTGAYLFFFFQYGYDASYLAVERMESQFIARIIRATHRYASGALVIATLLHAYRTLFLEKFKGPRWLAWVTGMGMTVLLWLAGVTGYWLIWDTRAQVIGDQFRAFLAQVTSWAPAYMGYTVFAGERESSWALFLVLFALHVILFLVVAAFFFLHIRRLARPRWLPPVEWVVIIGVSVVLVSALFPAGMLPQADLNQLPGTITFDPLFLFYLPFEGAVWFWLLLVGGVLGLAALPWLSRLRRRSARSAVTSAAAIEPDVIIPVPVAPPTVNIIKDRCTGCTKCALDCPYDAIQMVERHDDKPHKFIAIEDTGLCVSCGICVGSCDGVAVTLGTVAPESLWDLIEDRARLAPESVGGGAHAVAGAAPVAISASTARPAKVVVYTCERHARQGARPYLREDGSTPDPDVVVITLPCVGAVPPDMLTRTLDSGVTEVKVVGCPPFDCANREGNLWAEQRLTRQRVPRLRKAYADAPITTHWLPPDQFARAFDAEAPVGEDGEVDYLASRRLFRELSARDYLPAALLVLVLLILQVLANDIPFTPYPEQPGIVQVVWERPDAPFGMLLPDETRDTAYLINLSVDGQTVFAETLSTEALLVGGGNRPPIVFAEAKVEPGRHAVKLTLTGDATGAETILVDDVWEIAAGQIVRPDFSFGAYNECLGGATLQDPACRR